MNNTPDVVKAFLLLVFGEQVLADNHALNLRRALIDGEDLGIACRIVPLATMTATRARAGRPYA